MWVGGQADVFSQKRFYGRVRLITVFFAISYVFIVCRLFYLQVLKGRDLELLSESNRTQIIFLRAPRGDIYDRNNKLLVSNRPSWSLMYSAPEKNQEKRQSVEKQLSPFLTSFPKHWKFRLQRAFRTGQMIRLVEDVPSTISFGLRELGELVPGLRVVMEFRRGYNADSIIGHLVGYLGEIDDRELRDEDWAQRKTGDLIGKMGLERVLDEKLRGRDGGMLIEVDSVGRLKRVIKELPSVKGTSIQLTIDDGLQSVAQQALNETATKRGAAVVMDVNTGHVLAWVSAPTFDPARLLAQDIVDPGLPFFDRVYRGAYAPGSVFKIVTAMAALDISAVRLSETIHCPGFVILPDKRGGERKYKCWKKHGNVNFMQAMSESCDTYYYLMGQKIGADEIYNMARQFGFGQSAQKLFSGEASGILLSPQLKRRRGWGGWSTGDTFNMAIGQGYITSTPLQLALLMCGVATKGQIWEPRFIEKTIETDRKAVTAPKKILLRLIQLKEHTWKTVTDSLRLVVTSGTGHGAYIPYLDVRGKTGTAQNPHGEDHAWFACYAGYLGEAPSIAVCVFVENGGGGGAVAVPIAKKILLQALPMRPKASV